MHFPPASSFIKTSAAELGQSRPIQNHGRHIMATRPRKDSDSEVPTSLKTLALTLKSQGVAFGHPLHEHCDASSCQLGWLGWQVATLGRLDGGPLVGRVSVQAHQALARSALLPAYQLGKAGQAAEPVPCLKTPVLIDALLPVVGGAFWAAALHLIQARELATRRPIQAGHEVAVAASAPTLAVEGATPVCVVAIHRSLGVLRVPGL